MKGIDNFLNKFTGIAVKELKKREIISKIFLEVMKYNIDIGSISIKNDIVFIKGNQVLKSEIFLKKNILIKKISNKIKDNIIDIK